MPVSPFAAIFDAALREYTQKTRTDLTSHPLVTTLEGCHSPDAVLAVLREQAHDFDQYRNGDWKIRLMGRLKPIVDILLGLSANGVLGEGIGLVSCTSVTFPLTFSNTLTLIPVAISTGQGDICRCRPPTLSAGVPLSPCVPNRDLQSLSGGKGG
jgi:hypothetical protein